MNAVSARAPGGGAARARCAALCETFSWVPKMSRTTRQNGMREEGLPVGWPYNQSEQKEKGSPPAVRLSPEEREAARTRLVARRAPSPPPPPQPKSARGKGKQARGKGSEGRPEWDRAAGKSLAERTHVSTHAEQTGRRAAGSPAKRRGPRQGAHTARGTRTTWSLWHSQNNERRTASPSGRAHPSPSRRKEVRGVDTYTNVDTYSGRDAQRGDGEPNVVSEAAGGWMSTQVTPPPPPTSAHTNTPYPLRRHPASPQPHPHPSIAGVVRVSTLLPGGRANEVRLAREILRADARSCLPVTRASRGRHTRPHRWRGRRPGMASPAAPRVVVAGAGGGERAPRVSVHPARRRGHRSEVEVEEQEEPTSRRGGVLSAPSWGRHAVRGCARREEVGRFLQKIVFVLRCVEFLRGWGAGRAKGGRAR